MGMYTQIRGWLNVDSISNRENYNEIRGKFEHAQKDFLERKLIDRPWVCNDSLVTGGSNGSVWIFIGSEHKNYDNSMDKWIETLIETFPNAEGRIDYQHETERADYGEESTSRYLLIRGGKIIVDDRGKTWCTGYGNSYK
jgi:hypothetical protein